MNPLQSFIEEAPIGAAMFDRRMRYVAYSPRWLTDHNIDAIPLGAAHYAIFPELPERWKAVHRRALAGETLRAAEDRFERADGSVIWLRWETRPWRDDAGAIGGIIIFTENITPQKRAEAALSDTLARLRLAQSAARVGIWDWDIANNRVFLSDEWFEIFGLPHMEHPSYHVFLACIHPEDRLAVDMITRGALESGGAIEFDCRILRGDTGETRWIYSKGEILRDASGVAGGARGAVFDITERKALEAELRETSRRKSEFIATLAHELRNPLAPIRNAISVLERSAGPDDPHQEKKAAILKMAGRQVDHLIHLVNDLLDVERISRGKIKFQKQPVDLIEPLARAIELCQAEIDAKGHAVSRGFSAEPLVVDADPARLTQVFANLIDNAAKYTPAGGRIDIRAAREEDAAIVVVTDNGPGIPRDMLGAVFDLFVQVSYDGDAGSGLGVGLALARSHVEAHGGRIDALSDGPGRGSSFVVRLPLLKNSGNGVA